MADNQQSQGAFTRRKYLTAIGAGASIGIAGCAGGDGGGGGGDGETTTGASAETKTSSGDGTFKFGFSIKNMNNPWLQVFRKLGKVYAEDLGHKMMVTHAGGSATKQIQNVKSMLNSGIDALLISPYSSDAAVGVINEAKDKGVPVYTANSSAPTEAVNMFTGFGSFNAGYRAGKILTDSLKNKYGGKRVIDLVGDQADQSAVRRSEGFKQAVKETDGVELAKVIYSKGWSQQVATQKLSAYLQKDKDIDGIYAVWGGGALAAVNVLEQNGMLYKRSNTEKYIPITNIDGFPNVIDNIKKGYIFATLQQPMPFYAPISLEYMIKHLETGKAPVPKAGNKVTSASSSTYPSKIHVKDVEYNGVRPFQEDYWSPGKVTTWKSDGKAYYPWLKPKTVKITQENADAKYLWGNYAGDLLG